MAAMEWVIGAVVAVGEGWHAERASGPDHGEQRVDHGILAALHPAEAAQRAVRDHDVARAQPEVAQACFDHHLCDDGPAVGHEAVHQCVPFQPGDPAA